LVLGKQEPRDFTDASKGGKGDRRGRGNLPYLRRRKKEKKVVFGGKGEKRTTEVLERTRVQPKK